MYLLDTSVWLERLLDQERSDDVKLFLDNVDSSALAITDFSYHSIGLILSRLSRNQVYIDFTRDLFLDGSVEVVHFIRKKFHP